MKTAKTADRLIADLKLRTKADGKHFADTVWAALRVQTAALIKAPRSAGSPLNLMFKVEHDTIEAVVLPPRLSLEEMFEKVDRTGAGPIA